MSAKPSCYRVVVRSNIVAAVEPLFAAPGARVAMTPLDVSSILAANHRANGCLDGSYYVPDAEMARQVASLSLDFVAKLLENSVKSLNAATLVPDGWSNPFMAHERRPASAE
jgi:hypothetical protein